MKTTLRGIAGLAVLAALIAQPQDADAVIIITVGYDLCEEDEARLDSFGRLLQCNSMQEADGETPPPPVDDLDPGAGSTLDGLDDEPPEGWDCEDIGDGVEFCECEADATATTAEECAEAEEIERGGCSGGQGGAPFAAMLVLMAFGLVRRRR